MGTNKVGSFSELLPVVNFGGTEFLVDIDRREFRHALLMLRCWKDEIERAIKEVKNSGRQSGLGKWFRRRWYISQARDRKSRARLYTFVR